jgi:hypothetical protein
MVGGIYQLVVGFGFFDDGVKNWLVFGVRRVY